MSDRRCPICGKGILQHLGTETSRDEQQPESTILETYSCGHTVTEPALETADAERLEVERRTGEDVVGPPPDADSDERPD